MTADVLVIFAGRLSFEQKKTAFWFGPCFWSRDIYARCAWESSTGGIRSIPGTKRTIVTTSCEHRHTSLSFMGELMPSEADFITSSAPNQWTRVLQVLDAVDYANYHAIVVSRLDVIWKADLSKLLDVNEQAIRYPFDEPTTPFASDVFYYIPRRFVPFYHHAVKAFAESSNRVEAQQTFLVRCKEADVPCRPLVAGLYPSATSQWHEERNPLFYMRGSRPWGIGTNIFAAVIVILLVALAGLSWLVARPRRIK
jgi:hypothetical protein